MSFVFLLPLRDFTNQKIVSNDSNLLSRNGYPWGVTITYNMNDVVTRDRNEPKDPITTVPRRDVFIVLPYLGLQGEFITKQLKSCIYKFYRCINLKKIFRNTHRIISLFPHKDRRNSSLKSKIVYKASCWDCDEFYISKTKRQLPDRKTKHFKALTKSCQASAIADHITDHFEILITGSLDIYCTIKESFIIH